MYEAQAEMIEERVAAGELTSAQADYLKAVLKARIDYYAAEGCDSEGVFGLGMGMRSRAPGRGFRGCPDPCWRTRPTIDGF